MKEILERISEPTPKFWQKIRKIAITVGVIGGIIATAPLSLPSGIVVLGGYLVTAGAIGTTLSQMTSDLR